MKLREELEKRWLIYQFSNEKLFDVYNKWWEKFYIWFDPSADSLQLGNMCAIMAAVNLMKYWNKCYFLVWWATWMIWDPSLKEAERLFLDEKQLRHNEQCIYDQLKSFLENLKKNFWINFDYEMVDNYDFYKWMNYLDFLRDVGKYITVNTMIAKESVKKRIDDPDKSITYAEFSYMLIQGYDFTYLFQKHWLQLQLGWSDQWGNVTTGIEIIRKKFDKEVYALTIPLILDSTGKKFGKSEWNAIFLDHAKTSPYFVYQYFMNAADEDVERYLKVLTLLDFETIDKIVQEHKKNPQLRSGQKELAKQVIKVIFDEDSATQAEKISEILFGEWDKIKIISWFKKVDIDALYKETGGTEIKLGMMNDPEVSRAGELWIKELCVQAWLASSNGEVKKLIQSDSIFCNENKITDIQQTIKKSDFINWVLLIRKWKKIFKIVKLV